MPGSPANIALRLSIVRLLQILLQVDVPLQCGTLFLSARSRARAGGSSRTA
jgi:hypothetical protein